MNKFEKQLEKWNNGVLRGAQAKLAKALKVSTATTALWATGKRRPSKGYVAQMARLFNLDIYQVVKLFQGPSPVTYPAPALSLQALHEQAGHSAYCAEASSEEEFCAQSNTVTLPFFAHFPSDYPRFDEENILEWWNIPRRYAQGARYLVRSSVLGLKDAQGEADLCFIKPTSTAAHGQGVIFTDGKQFFVYRAVMPGDTPAYQNLSGTRVKINPAWKIKGVIISRIKPF